MTHTIKIHWKFTFTERLHGYKGKFDKHSVTTAVLGDIDVIGRELIPFLHGSGPLGWPNKRANCSDKILYE